ncbi:MAG: hypothetical protein ACFFDW_04695 [Candidatus Thorarchaeota archaeon]
MFAKFSDLKIKLVFYLALIGVLLFSSIGMNSLTSETIEDSIPPTITDIGYYPAAPLQTTPVLINCTVTDNFGVQSVTLYYRINGSSWIDKAMAKIGNVYENTTELFSVNDFIEFYIVAVDSSPAHNTATDNNGGSYYSFLVGFDDLDAPVISNVIISPTNPTTSDYVTINCTVTDISGIKFVSFYYRINGSEWYQTAFTHLSGDIYQIKLYPYLNPVFIEFYITAYDNSTNLNLGINDNSGSYFSFYVTTIPPTTETSPIAYFIPIIAIATIGVFYKRRK